MPQNPEKNVTVTHYQIVITKLGHVSIFSNVSKCGKPLGGHRKFKKPVSLPF